MTVLSTRLIKGVEERGEVHDHARSTPPPSARVRAPNRDIYVSYNTNQVTSHSQQTQQINKRNSGVADEPTTSLSETHKTRIFRSYTHDIISTIKTLHVVYPPYDSHRQNGQSEVGNSGIALHRHRHTRGIHRTHLKMILTTTDDRDTRNTGWITGRMVRREGVYLLKVLTLTVLSIKHLTTGTVGTHHRPRDVRGMRYL